MTQLFLKSNGPVPALSQLLDPLGLKSDLQTLSGNWQSLQVESPSTLESLRNELRNISQTSHLDFGLFANRPKAEDFKILAMDMDSTLITIECIDEIADFVGKKAEVSAITEAAMRGEITDFSESLYRRVALLQGVKADDLEAVYRERLKLSPGAEGLITFAKQQGWKTVLVSGGFTFFTDRLRERLGLDITRSNTLEIIDGLLTGKVLGPIVDGQKKKTTVEEVCAEMNIPTSQAIAMGDGANDLPMMSISGLSVAYRAKPAVQAQCMLQINHHGLDLLTEMLKI